MEKAIPHGTYGGYANHKCRCDDCKAAMRAYHRARYAAKPEYYRRHGEAWRAANLDRVRAKAAIAQKRRYASNPEVRAKAIADAKAWTLANPESVRISRRAYKQRNPDVVREHVERRRARKVAAGVYAVSTRDWLRLCARHDNRCAYCGKAKKLTFDHVVPIVRGGQHSIGNLLPACGTCNSSKGSKLLVEWRRRPTHGEEGRRREAG